MAAGLKVKQICGKRILGRLPLISYLLKKKRNRRKNFGSEFSVLPLLSKFELILTVTNFL